MILGADTGLFVGYANAHPQALTIWQELAEGLHTLIVSTLTINEILVYFYRHGDGKQAQEWLNLIQETDNIKFVSVSIEIATRSAQYRHSLGLPTVDSIILATFLEHGCTKMFSTDSHFRIVDERKILAVEFIT